MAAAYDFPASATGAGQRIGIIELGGGYQASDLNSFFSNLGVAKPQVAAVSVDGGTNSPTGDASGPDGEVELDIEVAGSVAPGAQIAVYFAPNTDQGFIDAVSTAVHDTNLEAIPCFDQLGRAGRFMDRASARCTEFRLSGCSRHGRDRSRRLGR